MLASRWNHGVYVEGGHMQKGRKETPLACFAPARHERPSKPAGAALCSPPAGPVRWASRFFNPCLHMRVETLIIRTRVRVAFSHAKIRGIMPTPLARRHHACMDSSGRPSPAGWRRQQRPAATLMSLIAHACPHCAPTTTKRLCAHR